MRPQAVQVQPGGLELQVEGGEGRLPGDSGRDYRWVCRGFGVAGAQSGGRKRHGWGVEQGPGDLQVRESEGEAGKPRAVDSRGQSWVRAVGTGRPEPCT